MQRMAGPRHLPGADHRPARGRAGDPARGHRRRCAPRSTSSCPGTVVAPMYLRGRAIGALMAIGATDDALRDLAAEGAAAIALAADLHRPHRRRPPPQARRAPAAEIQQHLLPPRILRIGGALIAGNVLPGYDIGGDWFDYAENPDCAWIGIADTAGPRPDRGRARDRHARRLPRRAPALDRPRRRRRAMHAVLSEVAHDEVNATATDRDLERPVLDHALAHLRRARADPDHRRRPARSPRRGRAARRSAIPACPTPRAAEPAHRRRRTPAAALRRRAEPPHPRRRDPRARRHPRRRPQSAAESAAGTLRAIEDAVREAVDSRSTTTPPSSCSFRRAQPPLTAPNERSVVQRRVVSLHSRTTLQLDRSTRLGSAIRACCSWRGRSCRR